MQLVDELVSSVSTVSSGNIAVTRLDGSLVAGTDINIQARNTTLNIVDTGFFDQSIFDRLTANRFWEKDVWEGSVVEKSIANNHIAFGRRNIAGVPVPLPPDEFDKGYHPDFFVFVTVEEEAVDELVHQIDQAINNEVADLIFNSVLIGLGGLVIFLVVVACVSHVLTRPLTWMEATAWKIVNHADQRVMEELVVSDAPNTSGDPMVRCSPKTEIGELVTEFQVMIRGFSGTGSSRVAPKKNDELKNFVTWKDDFRQFYQLNQTMEERIKEEMSQKAQSYGRRISIGKRSRNTSSYGPTASEIIATMSECSQVSEEDSTFRSSMVNQHQNHQKQYGRTDSFTLFKRPLTRTNLGSNIAVRESCTHFDTAEDSVRVSRSSLFRWVLCSIVLPLVLTNAVIAALVTDNLLASKFPCSLEQAEDFSLELGVEFLRSSGRLQSLYADQVLSGSMRDLHMLSRISGWLLFGAVKRSESFADVEIPMVEECKAYGPDDVCPFDADPSRSPCDCAWKDPWGRECEDFSVRTRSLQRMWFLGQARDFDPETGARPSQSFPEFDFNPVSTKWWTTADEMPGADKGVNASGYETTYDRLRVSSAIQTITLPLYNSYSLHGSNGPRTSASSYLAFEADGGYLGYAGCNYDASRYSRFKSSDENEAYLVNPGLCPLGKYGYDPRCRHWYADTKRKSMWEEGYVHLTAPFKLAAKDDIGATACAGLADPESGEYIGATAVDLSLNEIFSKLATSGAEFYFVISADEGDDIIINQGHPLNDPPEKIADVVLPNDAENSENRVNFAEIVYKMKAGKSGDERFSRKSLKGTNDEMFIAFSPITVRVLKATRPDDFSRGVETAKVVMYSAAVFESRETLEAEFQAMLEQINESLNTTAIVFVSVVAVVTFLCIITTAMVRATMLGSGGCLDLPNKSFFVRFRQRLPSLFSSCFVLCNE